MAKNLEGQSEVTIPLRHNNSFQGWRSIFEKYDRNGDGRISYEELKSMIESSTYSNDIPRRVVRLIMQKADSDNSGDLTYPEFKAMIRGNLIDRYVRSMVPKRPLPRKASNEEHRKKYDDEYNCNPPPLAMIIISALEIIIFSVDRTVAQNNKDNSTNNSTDLQIGIGYALFTYEPTKKAQVWRYLTYMFVHDSLLHLTSNLLIQIMLGVPLEMVHKWWRVLIIYIAGVIAGSLFTSVFDREKPLVGASGGVYALTTAYVATVLMNWSEMKYAVHKLLAFLIISLFDIGIGLHNRYVLKCKDGVGHVCHLGGAIAGLLIGIDVLRNLKEQKWEKVVWWVNVVTYTVLITAAILWNIFHT